MCHVILFYFMWKEVFMSLIDGASGAKYDYNTQVDAKTGETTLSKVVPIGGKNYTVTLVMSTENAKQLKDAGQLDNEMMKSVLKMEQLAIAFNMGAGKTSKLTLAGGQLTQERVGRKASKSYDAIKLSQKMTSLMDKALGKTKLKEGKTPESYGPRVQALQRYLNLSDKKADATLEVTPAKGKTTTPTGQAATHEVAVKPRSDRSQDAHRGKRIKGTKVNNTHQASPKKGVLSPIAYDWKEKYSVAKDSELVQFAKDAKDAVIADYGILSNFQQIPFYDPNLKRTMPSAEHMFHAYKYPPNTDNRKAVFVAEEPKDVLIHATGHPPFPRVTPKEMEEGTKPHPAQMEWDNVSTNLMVFIQLSKALKNETGLQQELKSTGTDFIIEDTSKRHGTKSPETIWGDNGDGSGLNKLGLAQMKARQIIKEAGGQLTEEVVKKFYEDKVKEPLAAYYAALPEEQKKTGV